MTTKILQALLGCLGIIAFFFIVGQSKPLNLLKSHLSKTEITALAERALQNSRLAEYELQQRIDLDIDNNLSKYSQIYLDNEKPDGFFPIGAWEIQYFGKVQTKKEGEVDVQFNVRYDFDGNLIELNQDAPDLRRPPNFEETDALNAAKRFLYVQGIDTAGITLRNNIINKDDQVLNYEFTFGKPSPISPDLRETYEVDISGRNIVHFIARVGIDSDSPIFPNIYKTSETAAIIITISIWIIISIFLLGIFFKRFRHDELEFKRAFWLGLFTLVFMWIGMALELPPTWENLLLASGIVSLLTGLGLFLTYAVTESQNRDVWNHKEKLTDIFFKGFFRVREFGEGILYSLFISGITLLTFSVLFLLLTRLNLGYLNFDKDILWIFKGDLFLLSSALKTIVGSAFIGLILLSFWFAYLRSKVKSNALLLVLFAIFINLAGLYLYHIRPPFIAFFLFLPLAYLWGRYALKHNFVCIFLSLFTVQLFLELALLDALPLGFVSKPGIFAITYILLLLGAGCYIVNSKLTTKDFDHYVPEYVSRIAERERFLKELEIARTVQLRFLPQSIPKFPYLDIACICKPAMEVGGDYYDFVMNGDGNLGVVIGDVSGKGVSAAFYMTMAKGIIKTISKKTRNPKQILTEANAIFYENAPRNVFISLVYGLFDATENMLLFARAGHNPVIVRKKRSKQPELLKPSGLAIGLENSNLFSETIEEAMIPLEEEDIFVFYTDGISEAMNKNGDEFGEQRLQRIISENGHQTAQVLIDKTTREIMKFAGSIEQHDDITMVIVKIGIAK